MATRKIDSGTFALTKNYLHYDQVGSVMTVSNANGSSATPRFADAFGNALTAWDSGLLWAETSGWGHNTKETDGDLDLVYMYQRWYDAKLGVFLSEAPVRRQYEHPYIFGNQNPVKYLDPRGEFPPVFIVPIIIITIILEGCNQPDGDGDGDPCTGALKVAGNPNLRDIPAGVTDCVEYGNAICEEITLAGGTCTMKNRSDAEKACETCREYRGDYRETQ